MATAKHSSSSSSSSSPSSQIHTTNTKLKLKEKQKQGPRSPLHVLNGISFSTACNSASIGSDTSSASVDAPRGCLRFFLSNSSSSSSRTPANNNNLIKPTSSKTPKSTSNFPPIKPLRSKPLKENLPKRVVKSNSRVLKPSSSKLESVKKNSPRLYRWPSGKKPGSLAAQKSKMLTSDVGEGLGKNNVVRMIGDDKCEPSELSLVSSDFNFTPLLKMENASDLDTTIDDEVVAGEDSNTDRIKTPPVQASVSPEIQCGSGSTFVSTVTPVCYGAGYVVSGVSDKRKCRPRGVLIVGENTVPISKVKPIQNFDNEEEGMSIGKNTSNSVVLKVPSPIEASMNWLLSPCKEEDEDREEKSENASTHPQNLAESIALRSVDAFPLDISSPPEFQGFLEPLFFEDTSPSHASNCLDASLREGRLQQRYEPNEESTPFSINSLSSENIIRTPLSDSSSAQKVIPPWTTADNCEKHDQNFVSELLSLANLSRDSPKDITSITDLSFQFDCLATISNSMDLNQFQKILDDQAFRNGNSSRDELLKSQMRVSWREGLMSRIYEMDEFDSCRCLSDEEEIDDSSSISLSDILKPSLEHNDFGADLDPTVSNRFGADLDPIFSNSSCSPRLLANGETEVYEKRKEMQSHQIPCSCAESISTDGGGLVASGDSDWNICYKNGLFDY